MSVVVAPGGTIAALPVARPPLDDLRTFFAESRRTTPSFSADGGRAAMAAVLGLGAPALDALPAAAADILALAAARRAAAGSRVRGERPDAPERCVTLLQSWASGTGRNFMACGYGPLPSATLAAELSTDAASCLDLSFADGPPGRAGALWAAAEEAHAFAALTMDDGILRNLQLDRARRLCGAAARFVLSLTGASGSADMPSVRASPTNLSPRSVLAAAMSRLPDGIPRRPRLV